MNETTESGTKQWSEWEYVAKIRIQIDRQRIEDGYSLRSFSDRIEAEIESDRVFNGFEQVIGPDKESVTPVVDMSEIEPAGGSS